MTLNSDATATGSKGGQATATLSTISCGTQSLTGAQSKACSIYLSASAKTPTTVSLTSSAAPLKVPTAVTVPAGAKTAGFTVVAAAVTQTVSAKITGKAGGVSKANVITLYPAAAPAPPAATPTLSSVSCGAQTLTGPITKACSVYLTAAATNQTVVSLASNNSALSVPTSVIVPSGSTTGGFAITAAAVSTTQSATMTATANGVSQTDVFQLNGSSATQHHVQLSWSPPGSSDPLAGYHVYRSALGGSSYQLLNSAVDVNTAYTDSSVQSGKSYDYVVKSVDTDGVESAPSNMTSVTVP